jgi:glutamate-ammonia-ligase adenylyltransferase
VPAVSAQLSDVACVLVDFALAVVMQRLLDAEGREKAPGTFAVVGAGKLGAGELSYSSDLELLYVYDTEKGGAGEETMRAFFMRTARELTSALSEETHEGLLYEVAAPAWPYMDRSLEVCSLDEFADYAGGSAARHTLIRARPIAGDPDLGARFMQVCQPLIYREGSNGVNGVASVTTSEGGVPDDTEFLIDFFTQAWQLRHGARHSSLRQTGTLGALHAMRRAGLLPDHLCRELDHAYVLIRSAVHRRQLGLREDVQKQLEASRERVREICRSLVI